MKSSNQFYGKKIKNRWVSDCTTYHLLRSLRWKGNCLTYTCWRSIITRYRTLQFHLSSMKGGYAWTHCEIEDKVNWWHQEHEMVLFLCNFSSPSRLNWRGKEIQSVKFSRVNHSFQQRLFFSWIADTIDEWRDRHTGQVTKLLCSIYILQLHIQQWHWRRVCTEEWIIVTLSHRIDFSAVKRERMWRCKCESVVWYPSNTRFIDHKAERERKREKGVRRNHW